MVDFKNKYLHVIKAACVHGQNTAPLTLLLSQQGQILTCMLMDDCMTLVGLVQDETEVAVKVLVLLVQVAHEAG